MKKISIKREQSQAGLSFAERENRRSAAGGKAKFRPQVKNKLLLLLALLLTAATGAWADETPKVVFEEHFVSEPTDPTAVGFYEFINFEEGDDHEVDNGELSIFNSDGTLDINNWKRRAIKFRNLPLGEGKTYRLEFKLKGSTRFEDGINDGDDRPFCKASAQLLQGVEGHDISLLDSDGNEQRGEFENFDESNYKSYSMTFVFASEQKQKDTYALNNQGELAEKYYLSLSIFNPGFFYLKDVVLYEIPSAASGYTVSLKDGVKDADKWTISPNPAPEGSPVTIQYTGRLKVKGVTATSDAPAKEPVTLATPLTIEAITPGTIVVDIDGTLSKGMKYSVNGGTKTLITTTKSIEGLKAGDKVQFYGNGTQTQVYGGYTEVSILGIGDGFKTKVYGNIMSLLDEEGFATKTDLPNAQNVFYGLFKGNTTLNDASELLLPATTLAERCYFGMFTGCTSLTTAPKLPATTLAYQCYYSMFLSCTSLTNAYVKAAFTAGNAECNGMFEDCSAAGAVLHTTPGNKASWEAKMGSGKDWENWSVADDWEAPAAKEPATVTTAPTGAAIVGRLNTNSTALVSGGVADGGTLMYAVTTTNTKPTSTAGFSDAVPTAQTITASGTVYVWYYVKADDTHSDSEIAATAIEVPVADIVWDVTNITDIYVDGYGESSYEKEGVTLSCYAGDIYATWYNSADPTMTGIAFEAYEPGGFTFTAPTGKAFTKIEMKAQGPDGWNEANLGTGWTYNNLTVTWKGSAASTDKLLPDTDNFYGAPVISIVFYLSE